MHKKMKKNHRFLGVGNLLVSFDFCLSTAFPLPAHFERKSILIHNIRCKDTKNILWRKENDGFLNAKNEMQWCDYQADTQQQRSPTAEGSLTHSHQQRS